MRRITSLLICILMLVTLALPAMAAEDVPTFKVTANRKTVKPGQTVTLTVEVESVPEGFQCSDFGVIVKYNTSLLELAPDTEDKKAVRTDENHGGLKMGFVSDPHEGNDKIEWPGVGALEAIVVEEGAELLKGTPSGKVGYIDLFCIAEKEIDVVSALTECTASFDEQTGVKSEDTVVVVEAKDGLWGDANGDANGDPMLVDNIDAMLILRYSTGAISKEDICYELCDVNGVDGVDNIDAMLVLRYSTGAITQFPVEAN